MVNKQKGIKPSRVAGTREGFGDRLYVAICYVCITILGVVCLYPFLNVVAKSFSSD